MAQVLVTEGYLHDIADAIREKNGLLAQYTPGQMAQAIEDIVTSPETNVLSGKTEPTAQDGANEDLYVKYSQSPSDWNYMYGIDAIYRKVNGVWVQYEAPHSPIVPFATGTDEEIVNMIMSARNGGLDLQQDAGWAVGDTRSITVGAFTGGGDTSHAQQTIDIVISQFGDYMNCGCVMQFDFKDELATYVRMNSSYTNAGGWGQSEMKTTTMPALVNALPSWLKGLLIEFSVLASAGSQSATIETVTGNKLALRSEIEIFGSAPNSKAGEGSQIDYYKTSANRVKKRGHSGSASHWWERSPRGSDSNSFCSVFSNGSADYIAAANAYGVAPFGCI